MAGATARRRLLAIEAQAGRRFKPEMLRGLGAVADLAGVRRRILVYGSTDSWRTDDAIDVMAVPDFAAEVTSGL